MGLRAATSQDAGARLSFAEAEKGALLAALETSEITDRISRIEGPVFSKPYSRIYRLDLANSANALAAKICLSSGLPDRGFAERQFRELRDISQSMRSAVFRVPAPHALFLDQAAIVMDWAEGEELTDIMRRKTLAGQPLLDHVRHTGLWLRHFHRSGHYREEPVGADTLEEQIGEARRKLKKEGIDRPTVSRALDTLEQAIVKLAGKPLPASWLHGDFQPTNIIVGHQAIWGLDVAFSKDGIGLTDLVHFVNFVERFSKMPKGVHLLPKIDEICRTFESAYLGDAGPSMRLAVHWFQILDSIAFLTRYFRHTESVFHKTYLVMVEEASIKKCLRSINRLEI